MEEPTKAECISLQNMLSEIQISKNTLYAYINALGIQRRRFPFDRRIYIKITDFERIKQFIKETKA